MKPVVYIASPYTKGDPAINTRFQCTVFDQLMEDGKVTPIAPLLSHFQHCVHPRPYQDWIDYDLELLDIIGTSDTPSAVLRLDATFPAIGYHQAESSGADNEVHHMANLGRPVFFSIEDLYDWVNHGCKDERKVSQ